MYWGVRLQRYSVDTAVDEGNSFVMLQLHVSELINPRRASAERVTVLGLSVCHSAANTFSATSSKKNFYNQKYMV
jgi:hypothetical protein